jgi:hypothetical protein
LGVLSANILAGITEEVKIRQEGVFNDIFPFESSARWSEGFRSNVVLVESGANSRRPFLKGLGNVFAQSIS